MIELIINGTSLPLPHNVQIIRDIETTILNREASVTDFTYPIDIPLTDQAIGTLGYPNSLANPNLIHEFAADYVVNGVYIDTVTVKILKVSLKNRTVSISLIGKYGSFARMLEGKKVNELALGGVRTIGALKSTETNDLASYFTTFEIHYKGCTSDVYMKQLASGAVIDDYVFGQCYDEAVTIPEIQEDDTLNAINAWDLRGATTTLPAGANYMDPVFHNIVVSCHGYNLTSPWLDTTRYWWVPQFRLAFVIRKCFEECGFALSGNLLNDAKFKAIVLHNTFAINRTKVSYTTGTNQSGAAVGKLNVEHHGYSIDPRDHMPDMTIADFIIEVAKLFNLQFNINLRNKTVVIKQIQTAADFEGYIVLTNQAFPYPDISYEEQDYNKGYVFSFLADTEDTAGDIKDDVSKFTDFKGTFASLKVLASSIISSPTTDSCAFVSNENAWYTYDGEAWTFYTDNLGQYLTGSDDGPIAVASKVKPMPMRYTSIRLTHTNPVAPYGTYEAEVMPYSSIGIEGRDLFVFDYSMLAGSGTNIEKMKPCFYNLTTKRKVYNPHIVNWMGMQPIVIGTSFGLNTAGTYPMLSSAPWNAQGTAVAVYDLAWSVPNNNGFYHQWWKGFAANLKNGIAVEYDVLLDAVTANNIDFNNCIIEIGSLQYLCRKASIVYPMPAIAKLTLVRV